MTSKMPLLFAKDPPKGIKLHVGLAISPVEYFENKFKFKDLDAVVDDWIYRFGAKGKNKLMRDTCVEYCAQADDLRHAISRACASLRPNGKIHNHQSRVLKVNRNMFSIRILNKIDFDSIHNFDQLFDLIDKIKPPGIGPVTLYDVATRIAAYLKLPITSLYLHAGVRVGWCLLHGARSPALLRVPAAQLPKPLQRIPCDEVEDMLCAYRDYLKPWCKHQDMVQFEKDNNT